MGLSSPEDIYSIEETSALTGKKEAIDLLPASKRQTKVFSTVIMLFGLYLIQKSALSFYQQSLQRFLISYGAQYTDLGMITIIWLPFSFKIIFAPFLDLYYFRKFGKRKTYIIPLLYLSSSILLGVSFYINEWMVDYKNSLTLIVASGFVIQLLASIQDIANDGWVVTLFTPENLCYGAATQTTAEICGDLLGYYFLIPLSSVDFCNKYIFTTPQTEPLVTAQTFMAFIAVLGFIVSTAILVFKKEQNPTKHEYKGLSDILNMVLNMLFYQSYACPAGHQFKGFYFNKNLRIFCILLITYPFCLTIIDLSSDTTLQRNGMSANDISNIGFMVMPLSLLFTWIAMHLLKQRSRNIKMLFIAISIEVAAGVGIFFTFINFSKDTNYSETWTSMLLFRMIYLPADAVRMVAIMNFKQRIADTEVGGSFVTCLHVVGNIGWWWIRYMSYVLLQYISLNFLVAASWIGGAIFIATCGRSWAKHLDSKENPEFDPRIRETAEQVQYEDIPIDYYAENLHSNEYRLDQEYKI